MPGRALEPPLAASSAARDSVRAGRRAAAVLSLTGGRRRGVACCHRQNGHVHGHAMVSDSMEQRVMFGLDPEEADRWWGRLQEPNWPPAVEERRRQPPGRPCCRVSRWALLWVPLSICLVALSLYVAVAPYWILRHEEPPASTGDAELTGRSSPPSARHAAAAVPIVPRGSQLVPDGGG